MKRTVIILLLLLAIGGGIMLWLNKGRRSETNSYPDSSDEASVLAAFETMQQAMIDKDMDTLDKIIKDDTIFTHISGKQQTKSEYLGEIENGTLNYYKYEINDLQITVNGDYAELICVTTLTAKVYGFSGSWDLNTHAHFEKANGVWLYCNGQEEQE